MSLSRTIDAMLAAGCTAEQLAAVVRAHEAADAEKTSIKRAKDAERQRRSRMSRNVTVTPRDACDEVSPKKEIPPTPPKEKTTPSVVSEPVGSSTIRPEPEKSAPDPQSPSVIDLPATQGQTVSISEADVAEWRDAFPAVDVHQQLRAMRQWLLANDKNRKTARGMRKFVVSWLSRDQDRGGVRHHSGQQPQAPPMTPHQQRHQAAIDAFDRRLGVKSNDEFTGNTVELERSDFGRH
ncbi:hypothetical protein [Shinella sp.]|uniref:hypothetical protein n=1 Tax=Shinella sp. TaxID=1870904 RepID=UPI0029B7CF24|nr:hypothetical protein [Shinella sp.]MDX3973271.1 hypothetical protein [Shinella sp.]